MGGKIKVLIILTVLILVIFFAAPFMFTSGSSLSRTYEEFSSHSNFNSITYDLYREVSRRRVEVGESEIFRFNIENYSVLIYEVIELENSTAWTHSWLFNFVEKTPENSYSYALVVIDGEDVIAKDIKHLPYNLSNSVLEGNSLLVQMVDSNFIVEFSVFSIEQLLENQIIKDKEVRKVKKEFENDLDMVIMVDVINSKD